MYVAGLSGLLYSRLLATTVSTKAQRNCAPNGPPNELKVVKRVAQSNSEFEASQHCNTTSLGPHGQGMYPYKPGNLVGRRILSTQHVLKEMSAAIYREIFEKR